MASATTSPTPVRILIINPNTSTHMTDALRPVVEDLGFPAVEYSFFTSPSPGIASINSPDDAVASAAICLPSLLQLLPHHDAFLVACYSAHPLVPQLQAECARLTTAATAGSHGRGARKYVTGIFEASVLTSLALIDSSRGDGFGIVSTGSVWERALDEAVVTFLSQTDTTSSTSGPGFIGCETTGLNASDLHDLPHAQVQQKMKEATKRLVRRGTSHSSVAGAATAAVTSAAPDATSTSNVKAICLGCAGMVGLDSAVREACVDELGPEGGKDVYIVDGVKAGVGILYGLARSGF